MADSEVVFVVGAGASYEVGLPLSDVLTEIIADITQLPPHRNSGNMSNREKRFRWAVQCLAGNGGDTSAFIRAARDISRNMKLADSIDIFINDRRADKTIAACAKLAITQAILDMEKQSPLWINERDGEYVFQNDAGISESWFRNLINLISRVSSKDQLPETLQRITFVIFNYDRCVEHFLLTALTNRFGLPKADVISILNSVTFYHPYGQVGFLPWQDKESSIGFGDENYEGEDHVRLAHEIRTFTERTEDEVTLHEMRNRIARADAVVFLGFSFGDQNMTLLTPGKKIGDTLVFGTVHGIPNRRTEAVRHNLGLSLQISERHVNLFNMECRQLFDEISSDLDAMLK